MFIRSRTLNALSRVIQRVHTVSPWQDPGGFFDELNDVIPFDFSVGFIRVDPQTSRFLPCPYTVSNLGDDMSPVVAHNTHFWRYKQRIVQRIMRSKSHAFQLSRALAELPKAQRDEYETDFWRKFSVRYSIARYFPTRHGWLLTHINRSAGTDFSSAEQVMLGMVVSHLKLAVAQVDSISPLVFTDRGGRIVCADGSAEVALQEAPGLAAALRAALPRWSTRLASQPFLPMHAELDLGGDRYRIVVTQLGPARVPLYRVSWSNGQPTTPGVAAMLSHFAGMNQLSAREREVLALLAAGQQAKEIARELDLALPTVKEYIGGIYRKTGVRGRGELAAKLLSALVLLPPRA